MYLRKNIAYLTYRLNHTQLRERIGILCCLLILPLLSWDLFVRQTQANALVAVKKNIKHTQLRSKLLLVEKNRITNQLSNPNTKKLLNDYADLSHNIASYHQKTRQYRQETLDEKKLIIMLNAMFTEIKPLKMVDFVSMSVEGDALANKNNKRKTQNKKKSSFLKDGLMRKYYQLHLQGDYFAIMAYLDRIERFPWQLYWDELYYHVENYPVASVELTFHAMSKEEAV